MVQVLCRYLWSLASRWLRAVCQFDPPVETMVDDDLQGSIALCRNNMSEPMPLGTKKQKNHIQIHRKNWQIHSSVCFLISCDNISDWGNLLVQLRLCIHRNNACFAVVFACLLLLPSPEAHIKWFLHVVSEEAVKSHVGNVRAFAGDLHAFGLVFDLTRETEFAQN